MSQALTTGLVAFGAALVGALLNARLSSHAERRGAHLEGRVAARVVRQDLKLIEEALIRLQQSWGVRTLPPIDTWREHRAALATVLSLEDWVYVSRVFTGVAEVIQLQSEGRSDSYGEAQNVAPESLDAMRAQFILGRYDIPWHPVLGPVLGLRHRIARKIGRSD